MIPSDFSFPSSPSTREPLIRIAEAVFGGEYDALELPKQALTVLDIGANIGMFAVWAKRKWPEAIITCYEPNASAMAFCAKNAPFVELLHRAAVTIDPNPRLTLHDDWGMNYTQRVGDPAVDAWRAGQKVNAVIAVPAMHPKDLPPCDVLKIDAEGVEPEILEGYEYLTRVKACLYEYHSMEHRVRCCAACAIAGLRLVKHEPFNEVQGTDIWVR